MARTYKRDSRGRFASVGSSTGSSGNKGKTLKRGRAQLAEARGKVRTAKGKLAAIDPADQTIKSSLSKRAQRGAVTKAEKRLTAVKRTAVIKGRRMSDTIGKPKGALKGADGKLRKPMGGGTRVSRAEPLTTGGGTLAARSSLTRARRKLAENATPAQRGAVTRAKKYAAQSYDKNTQPRKFGRPASVMRKRPPELPLRWQVGSGKAPVATGRTRKQAPQVAQVSVMPRSEAKPLRIADTMRETMRALAQADARRIREIEAITGQKVRAPRKPPAGTGATVRPPGRRSVSGTLNDNLRRLAKSDAQTAREMADLVKPKPKGALKGSKGAPKALPPAPVKPRRPTSRGVAPGRRRKVKGPS